MLDYATVAETDGVMGRGVLTGQVALVTGGGRGIGRAIALAFAEEGAAVALVARTSAQIEEVAALCRDRGVRAVAIQADVSDRVACRGVVERAAHTLGVPTVLVNNAGIATARKFKDTTDAVWDETLNVNLNAPFVLTRAALPAMLENATGAVITIASIAGKVGGPYIAAYTAAKHGVVGLMRALAAEYARSGVTFNAVCPGYVDTHMTEASIHHIMATTGRTREAALRALFTPQGRLVKPEEVAAVCVLLASPEGRGINGQAINVDGGAVQS